MQLKTHTTLDEDLKLKAKAKYSPEREAEARDWLQSITGIQLMGTFAEALHDGIVLCTAINILMPNRNPIKPTTSRLAFRQMENIASFLAAIEELGVPSFESFQTIDLYEEKNMNQVIDCIFAVSRMANKKGYNGPILGPKLAEKNVRTFTEEQIAQAKFAVPLLQGYTQGASQKGMRFGGTREIGGIYPDMPADGNAIAAEPQSINQQVPNQPLPKQPIAKEPESPQNIQRKSEPVNQDYQQSEIVTPIRTERLQDEYNPNQRRERTPEVVDNYSQNFRSERTANDYSSRVTNSAPVIPKETIRTESVTDSFVFNEIDDVSEKLRRLLEDN
ncbi:Muscle-specific protein 20 [Globomyces sp. JEL0801]|nr:Muscle-specific protein 20 [Globomyces sp. JEL0801]